MKILLLVSEKCNILTFLKQCGEVTVFREKLDLLDSISYFDWIISCGYKHTIKESEIKQAKNPIIKVQDYQLAAIEQMKKSTASKKIDLKRVEKKDLEQLRLWRNEPDLRKYFREHKDITETDQLNWYESKVLNDPNQYNFSIFAKDKLIGHCGLYYVDWINRSAEFGIYVGDRDYRNGGYGSESLRALVKFGFEDLNLNKIWCEVYSNNESIHVYKHLGFVYEGTLRDAYFNEGRYWDSHMLSLLRKEYEEHK